MKKKANLHKKASQALKSHSNKLEQLRQWPLTPRQRRCLDVMMRGPVTAASIRKAAGCNNPPELVSQLRRRGLLIPCRLFEVSDRDGKRCKIGRYRLTSNDKIKALRLLRGA